MGGGRCGAVVGERRNGNILVFGGRKKEVDNTSVLVASCHPLKRRCHFWKLCRRSSTSGGSSGCIEWLARETALVRGQKETESGVLRHVLSQVEMVTSYWKRASQSESSNQLEKLRTLHLKLKTHRDR